VRFQSSPLLAIAAYFVDIIVTPICFGGERMTSICHCGNTRLMDGPGLDLCSVKRGEPLARMPACSASMQFSDRERRKRMPPYLLVLVEWLAWLRGGKQHWKQDRPRRRQ